MGTGPTVGERGLRHGRPEWAPTVRMEAESRGILVQRVAVVQGWFLAAPHPKERSWA
ncbi:hypothetical protein [Nocardia nepalensis]|uniref:hypothetical protein n=1 Tax=Nocardia nepalensis TaxID=3375448 RepID=UPI003B6722AB